MSITFTQFLSRIDEANISGSRGKVVLTPAERARVSTRRDRSPIQRTGGGVSYVTVAPEIEKPEPPQKKETPKPQRVLAPWIPGLPSRAAMRVNEPPRIKVTRRGPKKSRRKKKTPIQLNLFGDDNN